MKRLGLKEVWIPEKIKGPKSNIFMSDEFLRPGS
jgi:hypothetical protein